MMGESMKKTFLKVALCACVGAGLFLSASSAFALAIGNETSYIDAGGYGGTSLQDVLDQTTGIGTLNAMDDQTGIGVWNDSDGAPIAYEVAYLWNNEVGDFGIYDVTNKTNSVSLLGNGALFTSFQLNDTNDVLVNGFNVGTFGSENFGFYYQVGDNPTWYTEKDKNSDGVSHTATYNIDPSTDITLPAGSFTTGPNDDDDWIVAFEVDNMSFLGESDWDVNDGVFYIKDLNAVPEPTTMLLFGAGLAGLAGVSRRKRN
jgi:hypothetical protein